MMNLLKRMPVLALGLPLLAACSQLPEPDQSPSPDPTAVSASAGQQSEGSGPSLDRGTAFFTLGEHEVVINYGRPALDGRDLMSQIQANTVWRLGMNEATELESTSNLSFADVELPAGRYTLFAKYLGDQDWQLIFNSKTGQWGAFEHDAELDVATIPLTLGQTDEEVDRLTIRVEASGENEGRLIIAWGTLQLSATFEVS